MPVTKTLNPLPFNELEPKRFEDLVRQLAYDFKEWKKLEATGRSDADDGFDARGLETILIQDDEDNDSVSLIQEDRVWLIQCKREKIINPAKMKSHLAKIQIGKEEKLYGVIIACACDVSKTTRDVFHAWAAEHNISESLIWGKGELEDMLFQIKNDSLLFAYFGISLKIRKKNESAKLKEIINLKKKLNKAISNYSSFLIMDPKLDDYPTPVKGHPLWISGQLYGFGVRNLLIKLKNGPAYYDSESLEWDIALKASQSYIDYELERFHPDSEYNYNLATLAAEQLNAKKECNATFDILIKIPYEEIMAVDDSCCELLYQGVKLFVDFGPEAEKFITKKTIVAITQRSEEFEVLPDKRISFFKSNLR